MTMIKLVRERDARIADVRDERDDGGSVNVYLRSGFQYGRGYHCFSVASPDRIERAMRAVRPCHCEECKSQEVEGEPQ